MNLGIRAILYSARKWKKTLLVFCLLLAITTLVLSGLAIADAQEEQAEEVRGTTGASFTVERNLSTGGWASGNGGSYSTQEFITEEMLQEIGSVDGIAGYDAAVVSMPYYYTLSTLAMQMIPKWRWNLWVSLTFWQIKMMRQPCMMLLHYGITPIMLFAATMQ